MKKTTFFISAVIPLFAAIGVNASPSYDKALDIPEIHVQENADYKKIDNVAQYGLSDWSGVVGIARNISRKEACQIAEENPEITYFFYTKGRQMALGTPEGDFRVFRHGDTVFFKGEPWWGEAKGLADGYIKQ
jgi:hypothetical protein